MMIMTKKNKPIFSFWIPGKVVPKPRGRTRLNSKRPVLPPAYREWKNTAVITLKEIIYFKELTGFPLSIPVQVECYFCGFESGDSDNLGGSILDALVDANILQNDNRKRVKSIYPAPGVVEGCPKMKGVFIEIHKAPEPKIIKLEWLGAL